MNKELLEKLRDTGFPQEPAITLTGYDGEYKGSFYILISKEAGEGGETFLVQWEYDEAVKRGDYVLKIPTLSELIEACRDDLNCIERYIGGWRAFMTEKRFEKEREKNPEYCVIECDGYSTGKTPVEAVANLWLSLKTK